LHIVNQRAIALDWQMLVFGPEASRRAKPYSLSAGALLAATLLTARVSLMRRIISPQSRQCS
jgi:hypothetical protein